MRPTIEEVLIGIKDAVENHILPDLSSPHTISIAGSVSALLDHLLLRIEKEGQLLVEANHDIRDTFESALAMLEQHKEVATVPELMRVQRDIRETLGKEYRLLGEQFPVRVLSNENNDLRKTMIDLLRTLDAAKDRLQPDFAIELTGLITNCAKRQLDMEMSLVVHLESYFFSLYREPAK